MVDILVLGATGYTGKLLVEYLNQHPQRLNPGFTFALAGRSQAKLDTLAKTLELGTDVKLWKFDVSDEVELETVIRKAKVVINTVGPFWPRGFPTVELCARHGVHYLDLTGEPHFVKALIDRYDYLAHKNGAIIIPAAATDSVPSDLVTFLSNKALKAKLGADASMEYSLTGYHVKGAVSGGTVATAISFIEDVPRSVFAEALKPYSLSTSSKGRPDPPNQAYYSSPHIGWYGGHWPMRVINRPIVQRSWALFEMAKHGSPENAAMAYGNKFQYDEFVAMPGPLTSILWTIGALFVGASLLFAPARWFIKKILPQPGSATTEDNKGLLEVINVTTSGNTSVKSTLRAKGDCGYFLASHLIAEGALSLVLNFDELPYQFVGGAGVLTTATALGDVLVNRLRKYAKFTIETEVVSSESRKDR